MSINRSKVIWIVVSTAMDCAWLSGEIDLTLGAPTVVKVMSPVLPWLLPARSWTPAAMWILKVAERGSFSDGVKIRVVPCQLYEPSTCGLMEKAF